MKTILLTGPIGSGKSAVANYLRTRGLPVYDCDSAVKALYEQVPGLKTRIEAELGLAFSELPKVFEDKNKLSKLESIVYPLLIEDILLWKKSNSSKTVVFIESAIALSKKDLDFLYDEVLMIDASYETRLKRNPKVLQRDSLQSFDKSRISYTITNDSTLTELINKIDIFLCKQI